MTFTIFFTKKCITAYNEHWPARLLQFRGIPRQTFSVRRAVNRVDHCRGALEAVEPSPKICNNGRYPPIAPSHVSSPPRQHCCFDGSAAYGAIGDWQRAADDARVCVGLNSGYTKGDSTEGNGLQIPPVCWLLVNAAAVGVVFELFTLIAIVGHAAVSWSALFFNSCFCSAC